MFLKSVHSFFFPTVSILHELFIVTSKNPSKFVFFNCELQEVKKNIGSNWTEKNIKMMYLNLVIVLKIAFYFYYFFIFLVSTYERENTHSLSFWVWIISLVRISFNCCKCLHHFLKASNPRLPQIFNCLNWLFITHTVLIINDATFLCFLRTIWACSCCSSTCHFQKCLVC